jgi:hypothetical protein
MTKGLRGVVGSRRQHREGVIRPVRGRGSGSPGSSRETGYIGRTGSSSGHRGLGRTGLRPRGRIRSPASRSPGSNGFSRYQGTPFREPGGSSRSPKQMMARAVRRRTPSASIQVDPDISGIRMSVTTRRTGSPASQAEGSSGPRGVPRLARDFTPARCCDGAEPEPSPSSTIRTCGAGGAKQLLPHGSPPFPAREPRANAVQRLR